MHTILFSFVLSFFSTSLLFFFLFFYKISFSYLSFFIITLVYQKQSIQSSVIYLGNSIYTSSFSSSSFPFRKSNIFRSSEIVPTIFIQSSAPSFHSLYPLCTPSKPRSSSPANIIYPIGIQSIGSVQVQPADPGVVCQTGVRSTLQINNISY